MKIDYCPPGPVARDFIVDNSAVKGLRGPIGSGKSVACVMSLVRNAQLQVPAPDGKRYRRTAVIRNTLPELKTTTIKTWQEWLPPVYGRWRDSGPPCHIIESKTMHWEVLFIALDRPEDIHKLLSLELSDAWINEAREIPKAIVDGVTSRFRYPRQDMGGLANAQLILDTNPPDSDHWWYKFAEEETPQGWRFYAQPGAMTPGAENLKNLPSDYYERMLPGKDQDWIKVYVHGEYGFVRDGKAVYPEYVDAAHCKEFDIAPTLGMYIGLDFGLTPAATFGQRTAMGNWRIFDELVTEDMGATRFAQLLSKHINSHYPDIPIAGIYGDPAGDIRSQTDERTPFMVLRANGIMAKPAGTNDFTVRRDAVAATLNRFADGQPGFLLHPRCRVLRKAMAGAYCLRRLLMAGIAQYRDKPDKNEYSHVAESLQYMLVGAGEGSAIVRAKSRPEIALQYAGVTEGSGIDYSDYW
jgi:hypothetical protein